MVALPPAEPPARVVSGVRVMWPLAKAETVLEPGSTLTVRIASKRRRAKLSFVRVNASGKGLATVARRTLRRGSFTVTVPNATPGARYALRLTVAGRKRFSWVTTPVPVIPAPVAAPPVAPSPTPAPPPTLLPFCGEGNPPQRLEDINATVSPAAMTVRAGETLDYTTTNLGPGVFSVTGAAAVVPDGETASSFTEEERPYTRLVAGESAQRAITVPADTAPGMYRLHTSDMFVSCDVIGGQRFVSEPFEVTAP